MDYSYISTTQEALKYFKVSEDSGLSDEQVLSQREKHGCNGIFPVERLTTVQLVPPSDESNTVNSSSGRPSNAAMETRARAIQRPASPYTSRICRRILRPRSFRRKRRLDGLCGPCSG